MVSIEAVRTAERNLRKKGLDTNLVDSQEKKGTYSSTEVGIFWKSGNVVIVLEQKCIDLFEMYVICLFKRNKVLLKLLPPVGIEN